MKSRKFYFLAVIIVLISASCQEYYKWLPGSSEGSDNKHIYGTYIAGDFHQHTTFTDGSWSLGHVMKQNNNFGLDWWANSEHGGGGSRDGRYSGTDLNSTLFWDNEPGVTIKGAVKMDKDHQVMWRWQSLLEYSFPAILKLRKQYSNKTIIQGYEWNVPGHEHASMAIIQNQFGKNANAKAITEFEYKFDNNDTDSIGGAALGWVKSTKTGHEKTLEAISWLQSNYAKTSWVIPAHPERKSLYSISDFRDMNNAGPDVCFGFESMPGHQKSEDRGEYKTSSKTYGNCTYGGTGAMAAKVGGLWDTMLSEGRNWWLFANSDFHDIINDFYPGEYQKTYVSVTKKNDANEIVNGLRSGNSYVVAGDLIKVLEFFVGDATIGQTYTTNKKYVVINVRIHKSNKLNHVDIIAGKVTGKIAPSDSRYKTDTVNTTKVIARFDADGGKRDKNGIISQSWVDLENNWLLICAKIEISENMYFRLRGTNWELNVPNQTDENGNPLPDTLEYPNNEDKAKADLWFYSNPIFVKVK